MLHQQVSVDYWAMAKAMLLYGVLTALIWLMLRLVNTVFTLPGRLRDQQNSLEYTLKELQVFHQAAAGASARLSSCWGRTGALLGGSEPRRYTNHASYEQLLSLVESFACMPMNCNLTYEQIFSRIQKRRRYPDMNITEEDLKTAEKELDELVKEEEEKEKKSVEDTEEVPVIEDKKND